eukprot:PhM_4_TR579/c0_g1_i1/m.43815/K00640/cysE; serine O-acetyltransferase
MSSFCCSHCGIERQLLSENPAASFIRACKAVCFPWAFCSSVTNETDSTTKECVTFALRLIYTELVAMQRRYYENGESSEGVDDDMIHAQSLAFVKLLPQLREIADEDTRTFMERSMEDKLTVAEVVLAVLAFHGLFVYRITHCLMVDAKCHPAVAMLVAQYGTRRTKVDIHPRARIGRRLFISEGTCIVIGEGAVIGDDVTLCHGVTLSSAAGGHHDDEEKDPVVGDCAVLSHYVTVYGHVRVGCGAVVEANVCVTEDIPANVMQCQVTCRRGAREE